MLKTDKLIICTILLGLIVAISFQNYNIKKTVEETAFVEQDTDVSSAEMISDSPSCSPSDSSCMPSDFSSCVPGEFSSCSQ